MTAACPNCGRPTLPADTVCWHCGYQLPERPKGKLPAAPPATTRIATESAAPADYDFRALVIYGLLTLFILLSLWFVMRALGRQPVLVRSAGPNLDTGWVTVTDAELRYTLSLPSEWQWLDVAYRDQSELLPAIIAHQPYIDRALAPLGAAAGDVEILAVAVATQILEDAPPVAFVVIGRSGQLTGLDPQGALDRLARQSAPVAETAIDTRLAGQPQARFAVRDQAHGYHCRELFVAGGYLAAACAPEGDYGALRGALDDILDSFQLLQN